MSGSDAPRAPRDIVGALKRFSEDLKVAAQQQLSCRYGVCGKCNNVVSHDFLPLPNVQTVYPSCDCGERVMVRYFP